MDTNSVVKLTEVSAPQVEQNKRGPLAFSWHSTVRHLHLVPGIVLLLALIPALRAAELPIRFAWRDYLVRFWIGLGSFSILLTVCLFVLQ